MIGNGTAVALERNLRDVRITLVRVSRRSLCNPPEQQRENCAEPSCPAEERNDPEAFRRYYRDRIVKMVDHVGIGLPQSSR